MRLAREFFVRLPDVDAAARERVNRHVSNLQWTVYDALLWQSHWSGRIQEAPTPAELMEAAWLLWLPI